MRNLTAPRPASSSIRSGSKIGEATTGPSGTFLHEAIRIPILIVAPDQRAAWKASQPRDRHPPARLHRRDGSLDQDGPALWPLALRSALCRSAPAWPLEDDDLRRRAQGDRHDCANRPRRSHGWAGVRGLRNAGPRADAQAGRRRRDGQSRGTQADEITSAIVAAGARLLYLPPYSPDLNPIECAFAKLKAALREAAARSIEALVHAIAVALTGFTTQECLNFFAAAGYHRP